MFVIIFTFHRQQTEAEKNRHNTCTSSINLLLENTSEHNFPFQVHSSWLVDCAVGGDSRVKGIPSSSSKSWFRVEIFGSLLRQKDGIWAERPKLAGSFPTPFSTAVVRYASVETEDERVFTLPRAGHPFDLLKLNDDRWECVWCGLPAP